MKIIVDREKLAEAFALAANVAPQRSPKEILQNVKLTAIGGVIALEATDLEMSIHAIVEGENAIQQEGQVLLPVSRTGAILRESNDEELVIELADNGINIRSASAKFRLPSADPNEFPAVAAFGESDYMLVDSRVLKTAIQRTVFATDAESSRFALGGIKLEVEDGRGIAIGTDGRRLACCHFAMEAVGSLAAFEPSRGTILPTNAAKLLERAIDPKDGPIKLAARVNDVIVETSRCVMFTRLIEGRYPNWRQVLNGVSAEASIVEIPCGSLLAAIRQAAITTERETRGVVMTIHEGTMVIESQTAELGQARIETPIAYADDKRSVKIDCRFIEEFCRVVAMDEVLDIRIGTSSEAMSLSHGADYRYIVMPMALDR